MASRLRRAAAWLAPTVAVAALTITVAAVATSAASASGALAAVIAPGFAIVVGAPAAIVIAVVVRTLVAVWRPRALLVSLVDDGGGAPRLLGWIVGVATGAGLVAGATNQGVWLFARVTAFKPRTMAILFPIGMVLAVLGIVLVTRVVAVGVAAALGRLEARSAVRRGRPLLTPRRIAIALAALGLAGAAVLWWLVLRPSFGHVALGAPAVLAGVLAALALGHRVWAWAGHWRAARDAAGAATVLFAAALVATALWARQARPTMVLTVWGQGGFSADAIDLLYDLYRVRDDVPAAALVPQTRPGAPRPDILLITIDTLRADRAQPYRGPVATPALAALAQRGTVFDAAFAAANVTRRSLPAIATGLVPPRVRGRVSGWALRMDPRHATVAERLRAGGYHTIGLFCCDGFWAPRRRLGLERGIDELVIDHDGPKLVEAYRQRVAARRADAAPSFTWIHFIELHEWAGGNPSLTPELRRHYDEILSQVDGYVAQLVAATASQPGARQPIVIVTGDHGEALGDHGQPFHSSDLYNAQIRVPLIVAGPGIATGRIDEAVSLVDLVPTLLDLAGFVPPGQPVVDGRSLAALLSGARRPDPERGQAYAAMLEDVFVREHRAALIHGRWKIIEQLGRFELYDLQADANEQHDLAATQPGRLADMKAQLRARQAQDRVSPFP